MNQYKTYRNSNLSLAQRIMAALEHYAVHNGGALPAAIVVNPRDLAEASVIVKALELADLTVIGNGGCNVREVRLQIPEKK